MVSRSVFTTQAQWLGSNQLYPDNGASFGSASQNSSSNERVVASVFEVLYH